MPNPVVHFEIMGKDAKKTQAFYSNLFGWKIDSNNPMQYGLVDTGVKGAIGGGVGADEDGKPAVRFFVEVHDLQAYLKRAQQLGGKTIMPPTEIPNMVTMAMFVDPDGNVIGLVEAEPAAR
ncbi:MAG: VOC family protein [Chloroflexi bacterium]|nr:VOC family protein [Chloroflexota bacterium]